MSNTAVIVRGEIVTEVLVPSIGRQQLWQLAILHETDGEPYAWVIDGELFDLYFDTLDEAFAFLDDVR